MTDEENFLRKVERVYEVINDFVYWCIDHFEFEDENRGDEIYLIDEVLAKCRSKEYIKIIWQYNIYYIFICTYSHFYVEYYIDQKSKIIPRTLKCGDKTKNEKIEWDMTQEHRKISILEIFREVYCFLCTEEIEKRNKRYAMNILYYKNILPFDIIKNLIDKLV